MIHLLWPTIRPEMMLTTHQHWVKTAKQPFTTTIAVNTKEHYDQTNKHHDTIITGNNRKGVTYPSYILAQQIQAPDTDIIILASDDFYPPNNWDTYLTQQLHQKTAAILVNDGYIPQGSITIPIMTIACLKKLNRIIYHPSYTHNYSDTELYNNLTQLNLLIDAYNTSPTFEHKNWACQKRKPDQHDQHYTSVVSQDAQNYTHRMTLPIEQRLTWTPSTINQNSPT